MKPDPCISIHSCSCCTDLTSAKSHLASGVSPPPVEKATYTPERLGTSPEFFQGLELLSSDNIRYKDEAVS